MGTGTRLATALQLAPAPPWSPRHMLLPMLLPTLLQWLLPTLLQRRKVDTAGFSSSPTRTSGCIALLGLWTLTTGPCTSKLSSGLASASCSFLLSASSGAPSKRKWLQGEEMQERVPQNQPQERVPQNQPQETVLTSPRSPTSASTPAWSTWWLPSLTSPWPPSTATLPAATAAISTTLATSTGSSQPLSCSTT